MGEYEQQAEKDAIETARKYIDEIVDKLHENEEVSDDLYNDYDNGDSYHHERHVDKWYDLLEAATLLDELDEYEETDWGLWEGQTPRKAIATQAAYTYGNAVMSKWQELIKEINSNVDNQKDEEYSNQSEDVQKKWLREWIENEYLR